MDTNNETLCFITIVFPITDDAQIAAVKKKIETATADLAKVKTEIRLTSIRDGVVDGV